MEIALARYRATKAMKEGGLEELVKGQEEGNQEEDRRKQEDEEEYLWGEIDMDGNEVGRSQPAQVDESKKRATEVREKSGLEEQLRDQEENQEED